MNIFTAVKYCCILHGHVCVMGGETTRVENRDEMTRGETTRGETSWGRNVLLPFGAALNSGYFRFLSISHFGEALE